MTVPPAFAKSAIRRTSYDVPEQAFSGIGGIDDLEKKWHDLQKELGE